MTYPYEDGDTIVLGPEIFAAKDGSVICWKGQNYTPQGERFFGSIDGPAPDPATWACKIGEVSRSALPEGADSPMRRAVERAYRELTGEECDFIFSGWGAQLDEPERAVVEDRCPMPDSRSVMSWRRALLAKWLCWLEGHDCDQKGPCRRCGASGPFAGKSVRWVR